MIISFTRNQLYDQFSNIYELQVGFTPDEIICSLKMAFI